MTAVVVGMDADSLPNDIEQRAVGDTRGCPQLLFARIRNQAGGGQVAKGPWRSLWLDTWSCWTGSAAQSEVTNEALSRPNWLRFSADLN